MNRISLLFLTSLLTLSAAACGFEGSTGKAGGGGWIPSVVPGAKATFGFHSKCDTQVDADGIAIGRTSFSYKDHGANVKFKVDQMSLDATTHANTICGIGINDFTGAAGFVGPYVPQPASAGPGGLVYVGYIDNGLTGVTDDDAIVLQIEGGIYDGYTNGSVLSGGQIHIDAE